MKDDGLARTASGPNLISRGIRFIRQRGLAAGVIRIFEFLRARVQKGKNRTTRALIDRDFDSKMGLDTGGYLKLENMELLGHSTTATAYQAIYPKPFHQVLDQLPISFKETTFIDFGSGKGRGVFLASEYPFKQIIGVEFAKELHAISEKNLEQAHQKIAEPNRIRLHCEDAGKAAIPSGPILAFFNNPFGDPVMVEVSANLRRSFEMETRDIWIVYFWPRFPKTWESSVYEEIKIRAPDWPTETTESVVRIWRIKTA